MEKVMLSRDIQVFPVCLGAMNFGTTTSMEDSFRVLDAYADMGGNFLDTSNNYAHWQGTGDESETVLGQWLRRRGCRDKMILATKVGYDRHGRGQGLKREQIAYWVEESLRKLGTDYIDLYYAHVDDTQTPLEETLEAFHRLVQQGKVRLLGGSNYDTWRMAEANLIAEARGYTPYTVAQQRFTYLFEKSQCPPEYTFNEVTNRERLRFCRAKNIPLVAYTSLAKGGYECPDKLPGEYVTGDRLEFLRQMAKEKGVTASALAVAWMTQLHRCPGFPRVIPLFGSSDPRRFCRNLDGLALTLTQEELDRLNRA